MAFMDKDNLESQMKARKELATATDPVVRLRLKCLTRGANGIRGFGRQFRIMDDDGNKRVNKSEFSKGCHDFGVDLSREEIDDLFQQIDRDGSGSIDFNEFLLALRPPMSAGRVKLVKLAFDKMDKTGDGVITVKDLKGVYNARDHPKYKNGEWTEEKVFREFLKTMEAPNTTDGVLTWDEFIDYYSGISASIDYDAYFDLMMRNGYKL